MRGRRGRCAPWQAILLLLPGLILMAAVGGCRGLPIDWQHWQLPPLPADLPEALHGRALDWQQHLQAAHLSPQGLLHYRRPTVAADRSGAWLDLADQACWSGHLLAATAFRQAVEPTVAHLQAVRSALEGLALRSVAC